MPAAQPDQEPRPLTSREIIQVLTGIVGSEFAPITQCHVDVLVATVSGLRTWCHPDDVDTALAWAQLHRPVIAAAMTVRPPN